MQQRKRRLRRIERLNGQVQHDGAIFANGIEHHGPFALGDDAIHAVANPRRVLTGAIHVYGGDFVNEPRSQWGPGPLEERPYDIDEVRRQFDEANRAWLTPGTEALLRRTYAAFNARDVDAVPATLHDDVDWPNVIDGVRVHGHDEVRAYWARQFATIDPEDFYDFSSTRPTVRLTEGLTREIVWPSNEFSLAALPGTGRDVVVLVGVEPQLRWRTFCAEIVDVATTLGVEMVVTLGALLADVAHTRPVRITGTAVDPDLVARLGLQRSRYEGPTGIVGVLHDACRQAGIPSASLWAAVPHYVAATPSPKAALALVHRAGNLLATPLHTTDLEIASASYERQVSEVVEADDDVASYVQRLEDSPDEDDEELPTGDALAAELERFLREERGD